MELFANDRSIHEQFYDMKSFRKSLARLMAMRYAARRLGYEVHCHRTLLATNPMPDVSMQQALGRLAINERRAAMVWLTRGGPFWEDLRQHGPDDYLECRDDVVTDSAVGEAAYRMLHKVECGLVSVTPSHWDFSPVEVTWKRQAEGLDDQIAAIDNWRDAARLEETLQDSPPPLLSWVELRDVSKSRFRSLTFADDCFEHLVGRPFSTNSAERILFLLSILDKLARAFDANGVRTSEGHSIYQNYFTGGMNALFSDSSESEKNDFREKLTFPHPDVRQEAIFCAWHGKERHLNLRLHFSWPIRFGEPIYIVYAGPKLTKR